MTPDGDVLISTMGMTGGSGVRRLKVTRGSGGWTAQERWTSTGLKPYFNDYVVHNGHKTWNHPVLVGDVLLLRNQRHRRASVGGRLLHGVDDQHFDGSACRLEP